MLGHQFTVYGTAENPLFLAKEVAECIEHSNITVMLQTIDEEEKVKITPKQSLGDLVNYKEYNFLTEDGLYEVLMQSRKPIAKQFKKGVKQILHEVRTTGGYLATKAEDTPEEIMARALTIAQATLAKREERLKQLEAETEQQQATIELQQKELTQAAPKVNYYDTHLQSVNTLTTTQVAKEIGMNAEKLNSKLKELGIQYKQSDQWLLKAPYDKWGMRDVRTNIFTSERGNTHTNIYTVWTQRGRRFIIALYENDWNVKKAIKQIKGELNTAA
ncbi:phage antirepressor KilAC domain-containing protein [uncultured Bacteroides sp.]|uniref:phage antirepressor KilAC domain-containing protein n=1 Tax=uncultured Bacteroides sp. TaxID=162156 RepID=UPI00267703F8|nr:phage antirepressor KilAC domain-containing protein [uncultured Bacteroides sp.]